MSILINLTIAWFPIQEFSFYSFGKYIIHSVNGEIRYNNMKECYKKQKIVVNDISNLLSIKSPMVQNGKMRLSQVNQLLENLNLLDEGII